MSTSYLFCIQSRDQSMFYFDPVIAELLYLNGNKKPGNGFKSCHSTW